VAAGVPDVAQLRVPFAEVFERYTERARQVVVLAREEACILKHDYIGTEHILLGVLREEEGLGARVLRSLDITVERTRAQVVKIVGLGKEASPDQLPFTPRAKQVLDAGTRPGICLRRSALSVGRTDLTCSAATLRGQTAPGSAVRASTCSTPPSRGSERRGAKGPAQTRDSA